VSFPDLGRQIFKYLPAKQVRSNQKFVQQFFTSHTRKQKPQVQRMTPSEVSLDSESTIAQKAEVNNNIVCFFFDPE
jgi:hypothetical protein